MKKLIITSIIALLVIACATPIKFTPDGTATPSGDKPKPSPLYDAEPLPVSVSPALSGLSESYMSLLYVGKKIPVPVGQAVSRVYSGTGAASADLINSSLVVNEDRLTLSVYTITISLTHDGKSDLITAIGAESSTGVVEHVAQAAVEKAMLDLYKKSTFYLDR